MCIYVYLYTQYLYVHTYIGHLTMIISYLTTEACPITNDLYRQPWCKLCLSSKKKELAFKVTTISSIIFRTLSKPIFLPQESDDSVPQLN